MVADAVSTQEVASEAKASLMVENESLKAKVKKTAAKYNQLKEKYQRGQVVPFGCSLSILQQRNASLLAEVSSLNDISPRSVPMNHILFFSPTRTGQVPKGPRQGRLQVRRGAGERQGSGGSARGGGGCPARLARRLGGVIVVGGGGSGAVNHRPHPGARSSRRLAGAGLPIGGEAWERGDGVNCDRLTLDLANFLLC